ncbi:MAG: lipopolysaccharide biosynthesis protein [Spirochaetaceae bacterium]|nr:lipopolysaccharide biosynthesis protein [Spirochaetaceae bacterium]
MANDKLSNVEDNDEISLIDLFSVLWRRRVMIIVLTALGAVFSIVLALVSKSMPPETSPLPNLYKPKALLLINDSSSGGGLSSLLAGSGSLGGLASLAGVSLPSAGGTNANLALFVVKSDMFLDSVVDEFGLIKRYKIKKYVRSSSRKMLKKLITAEKDKDAGVITISFTDKDPDFATHVVNYMVRMLERRFDEMGLDKNKLEKENLENNMTNSLEEIKNLQIQAQGFNRSFSAPGAATATAIEAARLQIELKAQEQVYSQLKVQYELLKVTMASEKPVFQVLEYAQVPDQKSKPARGMLCIIITFAAGFFSVFLAFAGNAIDNIKRDPEAMAKMRGEVNYRKDKNEDYVY